MPVLMQVVIKRFLKSWLTGRLEMMFDTFRDTVQYMPTKQSCGCAIRMERIDKCVLIETILLPLRIEGSECRITKRVSLKGL